MKTHEQLLWHRFKRHVKGVMAERVENFVTPGMPDVLVLAPPSCPDTYGLVTWCELKYAQKIPARPSTPLLGSSGLNRDQLNWHAKWVRGGGRSMIIIGFERSVVGISGEFVERVNSSPLITLLKIGHVGWDKIQRALKESFVL